MSANPENERQTVAYAPAGRFVAPSPSELAARLPNLEVTEILGHGGMGVVYKGRQPFLDRAVAIKVIRPDFDNDDAQIRFVHEAQALAKLSHPYIVSVFDCGKAGDLYYFVMEYVPGKSLRQLMAQNTISERDVLDFLPQIGQALQHAHESGIIHRDVKPENILVDERKRVRLVDFGLAKLLNPAGKGGRDESRVAGTWAYMAPEQRSSPESVDHRADIFSTGIVCHEMLTGEIPRDPLERPSAKAPAHLPFDPIVIRATERDRERRYQWMSEMNADVLRLTRTPETIVRISQTVAAPVEQVFEAWTDPAVMAKWFAPTDDYTTPVAEADLKVSGKYRVGMKHKDRPQLNLVSGQYCRIVEPNLLSFTWAWESHELDAPVTQVTLEFQPKGEGTDVTLTHERFRSDESRKHHAEGWTGCLNRLAQKISM